MPDLAASAIREIRESIPSVQATPRPYEVFMLALCAYALGAMAIETLVPLSGDTRRILQWADNGVCALLFLDFVVSVLRAERPWRYLATWGWVDLLSSIPTVDALRWGRAARIFRILRVLRGARATKLIATFVLSIGVQKVLFWRWH